MQKTSIQQLNHYSKTIISLLILLGGFFTSSGQHLYPVVENNRYGFINDTGTVIIPATFDTAYYRADLRLALTVNNNKTIIYASSGKKLLKNPINSWYTFHQLLITEEDSITSIYHKEDQQLTLIEQVDSVSLFKNLSKSYLRAFNGKFSYLIDSSGITHFKSLKLFDFTPLDTLHYLVLNKDTLKGIMDINQNPFLPIEYSEIENYKGGVRYTTPKGDVGYYKAHFYLKDKKGTRAITQFPAIYSSIQQFGPDYLKLKQNEKFILYHIKKEEIVTENFNPKAKPFTELYHKYRSGKKYGLCDLQGNELTDAIYNLLLDSKHPNIIIFQRNNKYGFMNSLGEELTEALYDKISPFKEKGISPRSFSKYKIANRYGLIGINGDTICGPKYLNIRLISDDKAACVRQDSSARVYIINTSTGKLDDYYDLRNIKLLSVDKYYTHTGTENLFTKISPYEYGLYSHNVFNIEPQDKKERQHNINDFSNVKMTKVRSNKLFFRYSLHEASLAPTDESISIFSVDHPNRPKGISDECYSNEQFKSAKLISNKFLQVLDYDNKTRFLDLHLRKLSLAVDYKSNAQNYTVTDFFKQSEKYPFVFKTTTDGKNTIYLVPEKGFNKQFIPPLFDSLIFQNNFIFGRKKGYWYNASNDSIVVPEKTIQISISDSLMMSTQVKKSTFIYNNAGEKTLEFDSIEVINESKDGFILIKKDTLLNYITPKGQLLLDTWVEKASPFHNGFAYLSKGRKHSVINQRGKVIIKDLRKPPYFNTEGASVYYNNKQLGLIDTNNQIIDTAHYTKLSPIKHTNLFRFSTSRASFFGILSSKGEIIIPPSFKKIKRLKNGKLLITNEKGAYGIADEVSGNIIIPPKFNKIKTTQDFYVVQKNGKWGLLNDQGDEILPIKQTAISNFRYGFITAKSKKGKVYINKEATILLEEPEKIKPLPIVEVEFTTDTLDGFIGLEKHNIPILYNEISPLKNGCFLLVKYHNYLLTDFEGDIVLQSNQWKSASILDKNIAVVDTKLGLRYYNLKTRKWIN